jgi:hypothetical protein
MLFVNPIILSVLFQNSSLRFHNILSCVDRVSNCAVFYSDGISNWPGSKRSGRRLKGKYKEISFIRASQFSNDSALDLLSLIYALKIEINH